VAQLGARFHGMEEVVGSIPTRSTIFNYLRTLPTSAWCHLVPNTLQTLPPSWKRSSVIQQAPPFFNYLQMPNFPVWCHLM
jgi:hypothetical protein